MCELALHPYPHKQMRLPHIVCGDRMPYAGTACRMRAPHIGCESTNHHIIWGNRIFYADFRILYAVTASCMREPHIICDLGDWWIHIRYSGARIRYAGARVRYAAPTYCMRFPHTVCGYRIQHAVTAFVYVDMGAGPVHTYNAK